MYRVKAYLLIGGKQLDLCYANNRAELNIILREERASGLYSAVWYERA